MPRLTTKQKLAQTLRAQISVLPGVEEKPLHLSHGVVPQAYWVQETEFVHFHGDDQIDLRIPSDALRADILKDPRAKINPYARSRVEFDFASQTDAEDALQIVRRVHEALTRSTVA